MTAVQTKLFGIDGQATPEARAERVVRSTVGSVVRALAHRASREGRDGAANAAGRMNREGGARKHGQRVLRALALADGVTAAELGEVTGLGHVEAQRRLSDLARVEVYRGKALGWERVEPLVRKGEKAERRRCQVKGSVMAVWWVTRAGFAEAERLSAGDGA